MIKVQGRDRSRINFVQNTLKFWLESRSRIIVLWCNWRLSFDFTTVKARFSKTQPSALTCSIAFDTTSTRLRHDFDTARHDTILDVYFIHSKSEFLCPEIRGIATDLINNLEFPRKHFPKPARSCYYSYFYGPVGSDSLCQCGGGGSGRIKLSYFPSCRAEKLLNVEIEELKRNLIRNPICQLELKKILALSQEVDGQWVLLSRASTVFGQSWSRGSDGVAKCETR